MIPPVFGVYHKAIIIIIIIIIIITCLLGIYSICGQLSPASTNVCDNTGVIIVVTYS